MKKIKFSKRGASMKKSRPLPFLEYNPRSSKMGRWKILNKKGTMWSCICECGTKRKVSAINIKQGKSRSCGCLRLENLRKTITTHGKSGTKEAIRQYNIENWSKYLLLRCKGASRAKGWKCDLEENDLVIPKRCPVLGIIIKPQFKGRSWNTPTVDRIDPKKGYIKGNIVVVSWRANRLKCDATLEEIKLIYNFYTSLYENTTT